MIGVACGALMLAGCGETAPTDEAPVEDAAPSQAAEPASTEVALEEAASEDVAAVEPAADGVSRNVYYGDLHVHTRNSFDAYIFNVRATPDDAYRYAKGETIGHAAGFDVQLGGEPLDFLAVTDHAAYLGVLEAMDTPGHPFSEVDYADEMFSDDPAVSIAAFQRLVASIGTDEREPALSDMTRTRSAWGDIIAAAEAHNDPGSFTTFIGYEFTSSLEGKNLHRNVIFSGSEAPELPFSRFESINPEDLWTWLDELRAQGIEALAIPHNSNGSDGAMFERTNWAGEPIDQAYAEQRARNEPLVEVTQVKGTSETHPLLSPNDEWAGFEIMEWYVGTAVPVTQFSGGYAREALRVGLEMEAAEGFNPYRFGLIGSSDTHNAAGSFDEDNYFSKIGIVDATPQLRGSVPPEGASWDDYQLEGSPERYSTWGASGLTGVWAEENTRESIYGALRRKETFATTGPRMQVRFFAGYDLDGVSLTDEDGIAQAYAGGVPMGGDLPASADASPEFLVWAMRDPRSAALQRVQIIKGWTDEAGASHEQVFDVACSDGGAVDPETYRCPDNGAQVDLATCEVSEGVGDAEIAAAWTDPEFDPTQLAFYYVRVLENPTCRWSTWDAVRAGTEPNPDLEPIIQERAYTSPIWYAPTAG
jgi:hypothetical protein